MDSIESDDVPRAPGHQGQQAMQQDIPVKKTSPGGGWEEVGIPTALLNQPNHASLLSVKPMMVDMLEGEFRLPEKPKRRGTFANYPSPFLLLLIDLAQCPRSCSEHFV